MSDSSLSGNTSIQLLQHLATAVFDHYGHEGLEAIKESVYEFGHIQGEQIRQKVEALGLEANLENFLRHNGIYEQNAFDAKAGDDGVVSYELRHCPLEDAVIDTRKLELGRLLCEMDRAMLLGYNRQLAFKHSCCMKLGSHSCHFVSKIHSA